MRDFVFSNYERSFKVDLADGTYNVKVSIGDYVYGHDKIDVFAEGVLKVNDISVSAGSFSEQRFSVVVSGGQLNLVFADDGGSDANWVINAIEITQGTTPSSSASFWRGYDFGTSSSPFQADYLPVTHINARDRGISDKLKRDFIFDSGDVSLDLEGIPTGDYFITVIMGDQYYRHDLIDVYAEGVQKLNDVTINAGQFVQRTFTVSISDGELNIRFHDDGGFDDNWIVNGITIESAS
jgi:fibronectin type 3 domain-containing protein